jgi:hypothetical protein
VTGEDHGQALQVQRQGRERQEVMLAEEQVVGIFRSYNSVLTEMTRLLDTPVDQYTDEHRRILKSHILDLQSHINSVIEAHLTVVRITST